MECLKIEEMVMVFSTFSEKSGRMSRWLRGCCQIGGPRESQEEKAGVHTQYHPAKLSRYRTKNRAQINRIATGCALLAAGG